jgi:Type ISP C-terminal specificity domain/N-6 DNA Methylase
VTSARDGAVRSEAASWSSAADGDPVNAALAAFGGEVGRKLGRGGQPEDQLRGPLERLLDRLCRHVGLPDAVAYGEVSLRDLRARPDYAVDVGNARVGYIELKQPGRGVPLAPGWRPSSDERKQWLKLQALPNLVYSDGLTWRRYKYGESASEPVKLIGGFTSDSGPLSAVDSRFMGLISDFLLWPPEAPRSLAELIKIMAGLCDLLHDEVYAVLAGAPGRSAREHLTLLAENWRNLLFPGLDNENFAHAFAQTITFALLLARVDGISTDGMPLHEIGRLLGKKHSLIGRAFSVLTDGAAGEELRTIETLRRVVGAATLTSMDDRETDIYAELYERFLARYDPDLRTLSGSFYTPPPLAKFMVRFADEVLRDALDKRWGFADDVIVVDPSMGTGTFLLQVISCVAATVDAKLGEGMRAEYLKDLVTRRLVGFEIQVAPYAVAELRLHQALKSQFGVEAPPSELRFLTDALANPGEQQGRLGAPFHVIEVSRDTANEIKREWPVMVVIGNPPHVKDAKGRAEWIEEPRRIPVVPGQPVARPSLDEFRAAGQYESDLNGMEWYFWRWACWKVFEANQPGEEHPDAAGIVAFVTPCSFLSGHAFAGMREYLRRQCDAGWIINLSPEGNRPPGNTRIFGREVGRQVSIAIFMRRAAGNQEQPADVRYLELHGTREEKLARLDSISPSGAGWRRCRTSAQSSFRPEPGQPWDVYPALSHLMPRRSRGVTAGRSWVYAPNRDILKSRWERFIAADIPRRRVMFHETKRYKIDQTCPPLPGFPRPAGSLADELGPCPEPVQVAYRSFDRQWLIPDRRLLAEARTGLWQVRSQHQIFVSEQDVQQIESGPGLVFTGLIPDIDHFSGWGGSGVHPLWSDRAGKQPNLAAGLLDYLSARLSMKISPLDFLAYVAAVVAHPAYTIRFRHELAEPGIRVPLSADPSLWDSAISLGRQVIWLHTYGTRYIDPAVGQPAGERSIIERHGIKSPCAILALPERLLDHLAYDAASDTLHVGEGTFTPVPPRVVEYDVAGRRIVWRWLNDRTKRPRYKVRTCPELDELTPPKWNRRLADEFLALLAVLAGCTRIEGSQRDLLDQVCNAPTITIDQLTQANVALAAADRSSTRVSHDEDNPSLFPA